MVTGRPPVVSKSGLVLRRSLAAPQPEACSFTFSAHSGIAPDMSVDYTCRQFYTRFIAHETKRRTTSSLFILPVMKGYGCVWTYTLHSIGMQEAGSPSYVQRVKSELVKLSQCM